MPRYIVPTILMLLLIAMGALEAAIIPALAVVAKARRAPNPTANSPTLPMVLEAHCYG